MDSPFVSSHIILDQRFVDAHPTGNACGLFFVGVTVAFLE